MDPISRAFPSAHDGPVMVHSDIRGLVARLDIDVRKAIRELSRNNNLMERLVAHLVEAAGGRSLWIPAYNYDFCRTGHYDVERTPAQVGALPEFFRVHQAEWRTDTPVFSVTGTGPRPTSIPGDVVDPFGASSEFHQLCDSQGLLLFYGVPFSPTITHYVERTRTPVGPLYRYDKLFTGRIRYASGDERSVRLLYHVAPKGVTVKYDMPRLKQELLDAGVMKNLPPEFGRSYVVMASELAAFWAACLERDPFHFMDAACRPELERFVAGRGGRRLVISEFDDADFVPSDTGVSKAIV